MRFKRIFQIGVWAFCLLVAFSVHGSMSNVQEELLPRKLK